MAYRFLRRGRAFFCCLLLGFYEPCLVVGDIDQPVNLKHIPAVDYCTFELQPDQQSHSKWCLEFFKFIIYPFYPLACCSEGCKEWSIHLVLAHFNLERNSVNLLEADIPYVQSSSGTFVVGPVEDQIEALFGNANRWREFHRNLVSATVKRDSETLSVMMNYPLKVINSRGEINLIIGPEEFRGDFANLFSESIERQICLSQFDNLFVNSDGVMIGSGEVWISAVENDNPACSSENIRVITLNCSLTSVQLGSRQAFPDD